MGIKGGETQEARAEGLGELVPTPDTPSRPRGTELEREQGKSPGKEGLNLSAVLV